MKYTRDQRLDIGRRIYEREISRFEAAAEYDIGSDTARSYMRLCREEHLNSVHPLSTRRSCFAQFPMA